MEIESREVCGIGGENDDNEKDMRVYVVNPYLCNSTHSLSIAWSTLLLLDLLPDGLVSVHGEEDEGTLESLWSAWIFNVFHRLLLGCRGDRLLETRDTTLRRPCRASRRRRRKQRRRGLITVVAAAGRRDGRRRLREGGQCFGGGEGRGSVLSGCIGIGTTALASSSGNNRRLVHDLGGAQVIILQNLFYRAHRFIFFSFLVGQTGHFRCSSTYLSTESSQQHKMCFSLQINVPTRRYYWQMRRAHNQSTIKLINSAFAEQSKQNVSSLSHRGSDFYSLAQRSTVSPFLTIVAWNFRRVGHLVPQSFFSDRYGHSVLEPNSSPANPVEQVHPFGPGKNWHMLCCGDGIVRKCGGTSLILLAFAFQPHSQ